MTINSEGYSEWACVKGGTTGCFEPFETEPVTAYFRDYLRKLGVRVIRLRPGETVEYSSGEETDEGWRTHSIYYAHRGDHIERQLSFDGLCCDGRTGSFLEQICPIEELMDNEGRPAWVDASASQYDEFAEAAGY